MDERLFASIYVDECISPLLAELLRKDGWVATSTFQEGTCGKSDIEQLFEAKRRNCVIVTCDKKTFLKETKSIKHCGIIIVMSFTSTANINTAKTRIAKLLNQYTCDEFENAVFVV